MDYIYNTNNIYAKVGGLFVWYLVNVNLLYQDLDSNPSEPKHNKYYLKIVKDARNILIKNNYKLYHLPAKLPIICEPRDYVYNKTKSVIKLGGYILNDKYFTDDIFKDKIGYGKKTSLK